MTIKENFKTGFRDRVDLLMFIAILTIAVLDFTIEFDFTGGYAFFTIYVSSLIFRLGFFKNALNKYVTKSIYRRAMGLPKIEEEEE